MGVAHHWGMAREGERVERSSGAAPPPQSGAGGQGTTLSVHTGESANGVSIVTLAGELDVATIRTMEGPLIEQVQQRSAVLVDLTDLTFIDSSGIGALIQAKRIANGTPIGVLIGTGSQVERVFGIAGVGDALALYSDRDEAIAALASGRRDQETGTD